MTPLPAMNATAAALGGETAASTTAAGVRIAAPSTEASHTKAVPPPGAVFATRFQSACAPAASSTRASATPDNRYAAGGACSANAARPWSASQ